jgi:hypothetical protein
MANPHFGFKSDNSISVLTQTSYHETSEGRLEDSHVINKHAKTTIAFPAPGV